MTVRELKQLANKMTQWQHALTKSMGPLFSDPLRSIKRIIKQAEEAAGTSEEKGEEKEGQEKQRVEKRKRTAEEDGTQKQASASSKRGKEVQSIPASEETERNSDAG